MEAQDLLIFVLSMLGLLVVVSFSEGVRSAGWGTAEATRRLVHGAVGLFVVIAPYLFRHPALLYVMAVLFAGFNGLTRWRGWLQGMHGVRRRSVGTVTFPLALVPALLVCWTLDEGRLFVLQIAFLVLALADPLAAYVGSRARRSYQFGHSQKTWAGSAAFGGAALVLAAGALVGLAAAGSLGWTPGELVVAALLVAVVSTAVEALAHGGWDNFFVVIAVIVLLVFFHEHPAARDRMAGAVGLGVAFGWGAHRARFLDASGAVAGGLFAASLVGLGGWTWAVPGFSFFVLSSLLSKLGPKRKAKATARSAKGSVRDAGQVYANGGVAWTLLLAHAVAPAALFYWSFLGALAAAAADTWATELGTLSTQKPRLVTSWKKVPPGTSGGVSLAGTAGALGGAVVIGLSAWPVAGPRYEALGSALALLIVSGSGVGGALVDSLAGATIQARYRNPRTGALVEHSTPGNQPLPLARGWRGVDNDRINLLCTVTGALLAVACIKAM